MKEFMFHITCSVKNGSLLKSHVSEICVKQISVNQGVGVVHVCKVVHVRQSSLCASFAFVVLLMNQQQKTSKAINYFNWKVLISCVLSVGRKWVCGPSPLIQHAFQCKNQFSFWRHLFNWRYLEVLYFHVR